ncbi:aldehyde reductase [Emticicia aquatilis]|uniref:Aldehyde reductase n=1 Tax=Emticicia aquatilis TaxID=1537369 RepID=A0A916Z465_9BACT|nr:aldehyde reductase [Emticicia aquatilis]GGD75367.1 aldehyde reductase [Emticicia aquatilis]
MENSANNKLVLVTGGTGFVAIECIKQLLEKGYQVRTTLRSLKRKDEIIESLKASGILTFYNLTFIETDLLTDKNWDKAVEGCDYVLHVASPIHLEIPKDENEMIKPAVEGTLRVLKAARDAGVKRVVMTSNFGAVGYSHADKSKVITEENWTNPNEKGLSAYNKSKVMAEKAAWEFIKNEGRDLQLSVINPVGIFGPAYSAKLSSGFELLKKILDGSMKAIPNITISIVDVRDLADLHIKAMTNEAANAQRFLALSDGVMTLPDIAIFFKKQLGEQGNKISTKRLPDWVVKIAALFNSQAKALVPMLSKYRDSSNEKARKVLDWQPRSKEEALLATVESLFKYNF